MTWRFFGTSAFLLVAISGCGSGAQVDAVDHRATTQRAEEKSPSQSAWDDLRWLMTAVEAYATDNDGSYVPAQMPREGDVSLLDSQLKWYYENTFPTRANAPRLDPWGRPYRFAFSNAGKLYALYSLGRDGRLESGAAMILRRVQSDAITEEDLTKREASKNLVVVSGAVVLAPPDVLQQLRPAE